MKSKRFDEIFEQIGEQAGVYETENYRDMDKICFSHGIYWRTESEAKGALERIEGVI